MKKCTKCAHDKPYTCFYVRRDGRSADGYQHVCKDCQNEYGRAHYKGKTPYYKAKAAKFRAEVVECINELKRAPCADCGQTYPPYVMDFDHVRGHKRGLISKLCRRSSTAKLREELTKCELVCSNCHRERTHRRQQE